MEILNTRTDIRVFPRTFDYFQHSVGCWLVLSRPCKPSKCKTTRNISIFCRVKPKSGEKNNNISKNQLSTVYLKTSDKIKCATSEIQWQTKIIKCGRIVPPSRWDGPDRLLMEVRSQHDKTYELFLSMRTMKSLHFWSVVRKVPVWSWDIVIIEHHA